ncbi:MAG: FAD-dependent oxidoreductase [Betaproteobacteria bacterium]
MAQPPLEPAPSYEFVIVGAGLAGANAAETLRLEGAQGRILLLSEEAQPPYQRPPLSKRFITEAVEPAPVALLEPASYKELDIELRLDARVSKLNASARILHTEAGEPIAYNKLLIATGAKPLRLGLPGAELSGVHYLRTLADAQAIRRSAAQAQRAVVIGGSFIGLEVASSLMRRNIEVTLIEREALFGQFRTPAISEFFQHCFAERGARVVLGDSPVALTGQRGVQAVHTQAGLSLPCDMVVIGAGVSPATDFAQGSGLDLDGGVVVDRFLQTAWPDVYAAGDVANFQDPVFGHRHRIEHWDNAIKQGRVAARNMLGQRVPYDEVSYFFAQVLERSFNMLGEIEEPCERIDRGSLEQGSYAAFYLRHDVPCALFTLGRPSQETRLIETLIKHRVNLGSSKAHLADPGFALQKIPNQTVYILQGGGAYGAFEWGAVQALEEAGVRPDIVAGVSIGAINGALMAGHPERPAAALQAFWSELARPGPSALDESTRRLLACSQIAQWGVPQFFSPRWLQAMALPGQWPQNWTSLYDTAPLRALLLQHIDFARLQASPIRLMVSAVDIDSSELVVFDSYIDELTVDHIMASASLPPAFPWTTIAGRHYWDGGIVSNSPLERVIERCGSAGKRVFVIDLFPGRARKLPGNLLEVALRRDEIVYSERLRNDTQARRRVDDFQKLVTDLMSELPPDAAARQRQQPRYIQLMGQDAPMTITRIVREGSEADPPSLDFDFSSATLAQMKDAGYRMARKALAGRGTL